MDFIIALFGRFHPLLVHLPIGILFIAFVFECLSARKKYNKLGKAVQPALFWGVIFSAATAITGFFLRQEGGYEQDLADLHQNFGIATAVLCLVVWALRRMVKQWVEDRGKRKQVRILLFVPLIVLLTITGHWGGSLTHGEDYLFAALEVNAEETSDPIEKIRTISNVEQAVLYGDVIQPILEARCYDCHSARKQKGDLRLDNIAFIQRGGKHGEVITLGPADSSALFSRLMLPIEDDKHMPPGEKPQLSSSEIALIKYWIEEEGDFGKQVVHFTQSEKISQIIRSLQESRDESWIPSEPVAEADANSLAGLKQLGITAMPLSVGNSYLMVTFSGFQEVSTEQIQALSGIRDQLVWLNFSHTRLRDEQLQGVSQLSNLRVLYLNNTDVSDSGLAHLSALSQLQWLSVVGTRISDASLATFEKLKNLKALFLYQTDITDAAIQRLRESRQELRLDTGNYQLQQLPTDTIVYKRVNLNN